MKKSKRESRYDAKRKADLMLKSFQDPVTLDKIHEMKDQLETLPEYSLEPDPTGELRMTGTERQFTKWYSQHRNIVVASQLAGISVEDGMEIYRSIKFQNELHRINIAYQLRQINTSALTMDQITSVLSSYVLDIVPEADRLSTREKLNALKMLADLNMAKTKIIENATPVDVIDVESKVEDLSVDAIKQLIESSKAMDKQNDKKEEMIKMIDNTSVLSNEDIIYLRSCSIEQLQSILDEQNEALKKKNEEDSRKKQTASMQEIAATVPEIESDFGPLPEPSDAYIKSNDDKINADVSKIIDAFEVVEENHQVEHDNANTMVGNSFNLSETPHFKLKDKVDMTPKTINDELADKAQSLMNANNPTKDLTDDSTEH